MAENSLLEIVRNKLTQPVGQPADLGATEQAGSLLRTKLTGQAAPAGSSDTPKRSTIGEQVIQQQGVQQEDERLKQARVAASQQEQQSLAQQQSSKIATDQEKQSRSLKQQEAAQRASELWNNFRQQNRTMETRDDLNQLEGVMQQARLANNQYVDKLFFEGTKARIDNNATFNEEYQKQVFQDSLDILGQQYDTKRLLNASQREFAKEMQDMDIGTAIQIAREAMNNANANAMFNSVNQMISGGFQGYSAWQSASDRQETGLKEEAKWNTTLKQTPGLQTEYNKLKAGQ